MRPEQRSDVLRVTFKVDSLPAWSLQRTHRCNECPEPVVTGMVLRHFPETVRADSQTFVLVVEEPSQLLLHVLEILIGAQMLVISEVRVKIKCVIG